MKTLEAMYREAKARFTEVELDTPELDARLIIAHYASLTSADFISGGDQVLDEALIHAINNALTRRMLGEPVSRILGYREFWGLPFRLSPDTLDPRPDTELLVELGIQHLSGKNKARLLDLGTGSGCIALSILHDCPQAHAVAVDMSEGAVATARDNASMLGLSDRCEIRQGSWFDVIYADEKFDLIVSNPPYIRESDIPNLSKEVRNHDPILALSGGKEGLTAYQTLFPQFQKHLIPGGRVYLEIGFHQAKDVMRLAGDSHATLIREHLDLAGVSRVIEISYGEN